MWDVIFSSPGLLVIINLVVYVVLGVGAKLIISNGMKGINLYLTDHMHIIQEYYSMQCGWDYLH